MTRKKVALIGYGYWGQKIYHELKNFFSDEEIAVVDVMSKNATDPAFFTSFVDVLLDKNIQDCFIATPELTHFSLAQQLLENNKNCFVEKPLTLKSAQVEQLIKLAQKNNLLLFTDNIFLYDKFFIKIVELMDSDCFEGAIKIKSIRYSSNIHKAEINVFDDLAIHDIYLGQKMFSVEPEIKKVLSIKKNRDQILKGKVVYQFNKSVYEAEYSWIEPVASRYFSIIDEMGQELAWKKNPTGELITITNFDKNKIEKYISCGFIKDKSNSRLLNFVIGNEVASPLNKSIADFLNTSNALKTLNQPNKENGKNQTNHERMLGYLSDIKVLESIRELSTTL